MKADKTRPVPSERVASSSTKSNPKRAEFERLILEMGRAVNAGHSVKYGDQRPKQTVEMLRKIERAVDAALEALLPLDLEHSAGQDLETRPFNFPVVQCLEMARWEIEVRRLKGAVDASFQIPCYPTPVIRSLVELRDAAHLAVVRETPGRGNSARRTDRAARADEVGRNFVFFYRATFGSIAPVSKTGWVVDLLQQALDNAGADGVDAPDVLRRCVDGDEAARGLPRASDARPTKRRLK